MYLDCLNDAEFYQLFGGLGTINLAELFANELKDNQNFESMVQFDFLQRICDFRICPPMMEGFAEKKQINGFIKLIDKEKNTYKKMEEYAKLSDLDKLEFAFFMGNAIQFKDFMWQYERDRQKLTVSRYSKLTKRGTSLKYFLDEINEVTSNLLERRINLECDEVLKSEINYVKTYHMLKNLKERFLTNVKIAVDCENEAEIDTKTSINRSIGENKLCEMNKIFNDKSSLSVSEQVDFLTQYFPINTSKINQKQVVCPSNKENYKTSKDQSIKGKKTNSNLNQKPKQK